MAGQSKHQAKESAKPLVEAYKRMHFDHIREQLVATINSESRQSQKEHFLASVQEKVWNKLQEDDRRGLPERTEDEAVEHLLRELDRYPVFDTLLEQIFDTPELLTSMKTDLRAILKDQLGPAE